MMSERVIVVVAPDGIPMVFADLAALRQYVCEERRPPARETLASLVLAMSDDAIKQGAPIVGFGHTIKACLVEEADP